MRSVFILCTLASAYASVQVLPASKPSTYTQLPYNTDGHRVNPPTYNFYHWCPVGSYICQFSAGAYINRLGWLGMACCSNPYDQYGNPTLIENYWNTWITRDVARPTSSSFNTDTQAFKVGLVKMKVHWDSCSVCGVAYRVSTSTSYSPSVLVDISQCGGCSSPTDTEFECANFNKIVGIYGYTHVDDSVYGLGFICGPIECGPSDTDPTRCNCPPGKYKPSTVGNCIICSTGTYSDTNNMNGCLSCATNAGIGGNPIPGSTAVSSIGTIYTGGTGLTSTSGCTYLCDVGYESIGQRCTPCNAGYYKTTQSLTRCVVCPVGTYSDQIARATVCTPCSPLDPTAHYQDTTGATVCKFCTSISAPVNTYVIPCTSISNTAVTPCVICPAGQQLSLQCTQFNTLTSSPSCQPCPAGTYQGYSNTAGATCQTCITGKYTSLTGQASCLDCSNVPANGVYTLPTTAQATSSSCPFSCNPGYVVAGVTCTKCNIGFYTLNGVCTSCTIYNQYSYFLSPIVFNGISNTCPWDCNAGYYKQGNACLSCTAGSNFAPASALRTRDDVVIPNACRSCANCIASVSYQLSPCTTTTDRTCQPCASTCSPGYYMGQCNITTNTPCIPCKTRCPSGYYITGSCSGSSISDSVACVPCTSYTTCRPGTFILPNQCPGTTQSDVYCQRCTDLSCSYGFYEQPCNQTQNTQCLQYTQCPSGKYLAARTSTSDGACVACTSCALFNLTQLVACSVYDDTVCGGKKCNQSSPCPSNFFCNPLGSTCGRCPDGFSSDGMTCFPCPSLYTCNRLGAIQCIGELAIGYEPGCYGRYTALKGTCPFNATGNRIPTHSTFVNPNGNCLPYFDCPAGFYKLFSATGMVTCSACTNIPPVSWKFLSQGLTHNDPTSCLLECAQISTWPAGTCSYTASLQYNAEAYYAGNNRCPIGQTAQPNASSSITDCLACQSSSFILGDPCYVWVCNGNNMVRRGNKCYSATSCPSAIGYYQSLSISNLCVPMQLPWQPQGQQRIGTAVSSSLAPSYPGLTLPTGLQGKVCTAAVKYPYTFLVFCNQSFISFIDARYSPLRPRLLIGQVIPGYLEGFRDTALFHTQLFIALDPTNTSLYVSDTLNCLLRVVSFTTPGLYTTQSHYLSGTLGTYTDLAYPGRLLPILGSQFYLFPTQTALYMLDDATRTVQPMLSLSAFPASTNLYLLTAAFASSPLQITLYFANSSLVLTPVYQPCPTGLTSNMGGMCTIVCSASSNYLDGNGNCIPCTQTLCLINQLSVPCSAFQDQYCTPCPPLPSSVYPRIYQIPGSCSLLDTVYVAPCPPNTYLSTTIVQGLRVCQSCPPYSQTASDGAVSRYYTHTHITKRVRINQFIQGSTRLMLGIQHTSTTRRHWQYQAHSAQPICCHLTAASSSCWSKKSSSSFHSGP